MYYPAHFHVRVHIGRKARHNEQVNYTQDSSFFQKSCPAGGIRTHDTLLSRRFYVYLYAYSTLASFLKTAPTFVPPSAPLDLGTRKQH